jgi:hypothetical protein
LRDRQAYSQQRRAKNYIGARARAVTVRFLTRIARFRERELTR